MIYQTLFDQVTPVALYASIKQAFNNEITMLFESVVNTAEGNFSFIALGALERLSYQGGQTRYIDKDQIQHTFQEDPFTFLKRYYQNLDVADYKERSVQLGFSFTDGFIGMIGYDAITIFEPTLKSAMQNLEDPIKIPEIDLIRPKCIIAYSHKNAKLTIICNDPQSKAMFETLVALSKQGCTPTPLKPAVLKEGRFHFTKERFEQIIEASKENIRNGDVFQILLSNRYTQYGSIDPLSFYRRLRSKNPSPYLFLLEFETYAVCGSSPEVMVRLQEGEILLRPIAGTRKRGKTTLRDLELEAEMLNDPKERAEHLMLVDLGRNDVGRVAKTGTVKVPEMMRVERYSHVMHMVSDVTATLRENKDMFDLFAATFTAGTMTGAPKIKAMELIAHYEGLKRGFYSGSIGYFAFDGNMDSSIAIRTALIQADKIVLQAGAGVVADSKPELEWLEVNNKLGALKATIEEMAQL